ncbi:hypothetical protein [Rhodocytophaga rosea]|uniref:hypothetical protein n=1 Tax=Rhodocytophaga rosea TaxID=2704465 RepID=UPI001E29B5AA|nr:hypothetical protein [Rhodocytophaga rosea]
MTTQLQFSYKKIIYTLLVCLLSSFPSFSQPSHASSDSILITIFLKHQQDKSLDSLRKIQQQNKFLERFPPKSARVVSWYVMMGIGQVVTVKIPAAQLRTLNLSIEQGAWGAFATEFYPTYDFIPVWQEELSKQKEAGKRK